ncbi:hypothetical protein RTBOTA2_002057 [Rhodotorula toruloides]|nr:hypothetical protein RTBOTA2_002057 [Rhodotorula toruloides]
MNATATATLWFGACIRLRSLCVVGLAFTRVKHAWRAVDMIRKRRTNATLRTTVATGQTAVTSIPDEVWVAIKDELFADVYAQAVHDFVAGCHSGLSGRRGRRTLDHLDNCEECLAQYKRPEKKARAEMNSTVLLANFGLKFATTRIYRPMNDADLNESPFNSCCAITVYPNEAERNAAPYAFSKAVADTPDAHDVVTIDAESLTLPFKAECRFRRLFLTFPQLESACLHANDIQNKIGAPRGRSSIVQSGTEAFTENLHVNHCLCGEFILVVDAPLASLPRRPTDSSHCLVNTGPSKRVYKLNITETSKDYKPPEVPKQTEDKLVVNQYGAAGKNGNGVLVNRDGGFEFQRRLFCPRCQLQVGYETVPGEGQKGDATFILAGALSDIQNKAPAEAFGEPTVTPAGNLADQGAREAMAAA